MLGEELVRRLAGHEEDVVALGHDQIGIAPPAAVRAAVAEHRSGIVVNCATYTAVDDAETNEAAALVVRDMPRTLRDWRSALRNAFPACSPQHAHRPGEEQHETRLTRPRPVRRRARLPSSPSTWGVPTPVTANA
jgi:hypothetical protein